MSVHLFESSIAGTPPELLLLETVTIRLVEDSERERFDRELATKHYLKNANAAACAAAHARAGPASMTCPPSGPSDGCSKRSIPKNSKTC